jgi:hypothetical protein
MGYGTVTRKLPQPFPYSFSTQGVYEPGGGSREAVMEVPSAE